MGTLSRNDMEQAIIQKGSVLYQGRIISRIQDLPTDADLAKGNPDMEAAAAAALDVQIAALTAQRARLSLGQPPQISPPPGDLAAAPAQPTAVGDRPNEGTKGDSEKEQPTRHETGRRR